MLDPKQARDDAKWARRLLVLIGGGRTDKAIALCKLSAYADGYARLREEAAPLLTRINAQLHTLVSFLQVYDSCGALDSNRNVREAGNGIQESIHKLTTLLAEGQPDEKTGGPDGTQ